MQNTSVFKNNVLSTCKSTTSGTKISSKFSFRKQWCLRRPINGPIRTDCASYKLCNSIYGMTDVLPPPLTKFDHVDLTLHEFNAITTASMALNPLRVQQNPSLVLAAFDHSPRSLHLLRVAFYVLGASPYATLDRNELARFLALVRVPGVVQTTIDVAAVIRSLFVRKEIGGFAIYSDLNVELGIHSAVATLDPNILDRLIISDLRVSGLGMLQEPHNYPAFERMLCDFDMVEELTTCLETSRYCQLGLRKDPVAYGNTSIATDRCIMVIDAPY